MEKCRLRQCGVGLQWFPLKPAVIQPSCFCLYCNIRVFKNCDAKSDPSQVSEAFQIAHEYHLLECSYWSAVKQVTLALGWTSCALSTKC